MDRDQIIEREARWRPYAVASAMASFTLYLVALILLSSSGIAAGELLTDSLRTYEQETATLMIAAVISAISVLCLGLPLLYLFKAAQARTAKVRGIFAPLTIAGPVLLALYGFLGSIGQAQIASDFVSQATGVGDIYSLAERLIDDSGVFQLARSLYFPALLILIFVMIYVPVWSIRTGLIHKTAGTIGMAIGAIQIFVPPQIGMMILVLWFGYIAVLLSGRLPGGRPPAWEEGVAIPWDPRAQEPPLPVVVEADAREIPGVGESPHAARRERAKRRKRKRR